MNETTSGLSARSRCPALRAILNLCRSYAVEIASKEENVPIFAAATRAKVPNRASPWWIAAIISKLTIQAISVGPSVAFRFNPDPPKGGALALNPNAIELYLTGWGWQLFTI